MCVWMYGVFGVLSINIGYRMLGCILYNVWSSAISGHFFVPIEFVCILWRKSVVAKPQVRTDHLTGICAGPETEPSTV